MAKAKHTFYRRLKDDTGCDQIVIADEGGKPLLQVITRIRYKTSDLSGDVWRTSAMWQQATGSKWEDFDGPYQDVKTACKVLFPGLYGSHPNWWEIPVGTTDFYWKGIKWYESSWDGQVVTLLAAAGHLPWALVKAGEDHPGIPGKWSDKCFQAGCPNDAVSTYRLKELFSGTGHKLDSADGSGFIFHRRFCKSHLERGDSNREDCDNNYIVVSGPGPDKCDWEGATISEASFGGFIDLSDKLD